jgi:acyl phosphate:glycerol-3-phosphate acyltransferase
MLEETPHMGIGLATLAAVVGYILGSVPFGILVCRALGKDPLTVGSGRTGGTNVYRTAGLAPALATVAGDVLKGYLAVALAGRLVPAASYADYHGLAMALAAVGAIAGHNYSLFLGFRGGAGSGPNMGAALAFDPLVLACGLGLGGLSLIGARMASLASLVLALVLLVGLSWRVLDGSLPPAALLYAFGQMALVAWALRPNIARIRAGTERRIDLPGRRGPSDRGSVAED